MNGRKTSPKYTVDFGIKDYRRLGLWKYVYTSNTGVVRGASFLHRLRCVHGRWNVKSLVVQLFCFTVHFAASGKEHVGQMSSTLSQRDPKIRVNPMRNVNKPSTGLGSGLPSSPSHPILAFGFFCSASTKPQSRLPPRIWQRQSMSVVIC